LIIKDKKNKKFERRETNAGILKSFSINEEQTKVFQSFSEAKGNKKRYSRFSKCEKATNRGIPIFFRSTEKLREAFRTQ